MEGGGARSDPHDGQKIFGKASDPIRLMIDRRARPVRAFLVRIGADRPIRTHNPVVNIVGQLLVKRDPDVGLDQIPRRAQSAGVRRPQLLESLAEKWPILRQDALQPVRVDRDRRHVLSCFPGSSHSCIGMPGRSSRRSAARVHPRLLFPASRATVGRGLECSTLLMRCLTATQRIIEGVNVVSSRGSEREPGFVMDRLPAKQRSTFGRMVF